MKTQFRYHLRPLAIAAAVAAAGLGLYAALAPASQPTGVALAALPFYSLPFGPDEAGAERPFWPSRMQTATGRMTDPARLPTSAECGSCHRTEFEEWAGSLHAAADRDLVYEATVEANVDLLRHGAEQGRFCEGCHAPGEMLAGRVTRHVAVAPADALTEGVSCIACHTAIHADPVEGNGALTLAYDRAEAERDGPQGAALLADPRAHLAAYGAPDGSRFEAPVSSWPVRMERQPLAKFLSRKPAPLSHRAVSGFLSRLKRGNLRYPSEFLHALEKHKSSTAPKVEAA